MTAKKQMPAAELRSALTRSVKRIQELRREDMESRDQQEKRSSLWFFYDGRVRAHSQSLDVLFAWTKGEFGENYDPMGGA